jgi:hypothetical protein
MDKRKSIQKEAMLRREKVKSAYKSSAWSARVDKMSDSQITAVYLRLRSEGKV